MKCLNQNEFVQISGAGANSATENVGANRGRGRNNGSAGGGAYSGVSNDCLQDMALGFAAGAVSGNLLAGALSMIANSRKSCTSDNGGGDNNRGGSVSPGQCTW